MVGGVTVHQLDLLINKRHEAMRMAHDTLWGGHLGARKCAQRIRMSFWWPTVVTDIKQYCATCNECQLRTRKTIRNQTLMQAIVRPSQTWDKVNCDLINPLEEKSLAGHTYVLVLIDQCSRWVEAIPLKAATAKASCDALLEIFTRTGIPKVIVSDNGINFTSNLTAEFRARLECTPRFSTPGYLEGDSLVERHNAVIKNMLHHVIRQNKRNWHKQLPIQLWAMREVPNQTTGLSPFQIVYGKLPRGPLSVLKETWAGELSVPPDFGITAIEYMQDVKSRLEKAGQLSAEHTQTNRRAMLTDITCELMSSYLS